MVFQKQIVLPPHPRGFHLIDKFVLDNLPPYTGLMHLFIQHTSASLTLNENADPSVREDFETHFNHLVSESEPYYKHTVEGTDDMTAHIKSSLLGASVSFPIRKGIPLFGTWQGIYLCEHRNHAGARTILLSIIGSKSIP